MDQKAYKRGYIVAVGLCIASVFVGCNHVTGEMIEVTAQQPIAEKTAVSEQTLIPPAEGEEEDFETPDGSPDPGEEIPHEIMSHTQDYQRYKAINSDVIGWISVPNTRIEYPVVIAADNDYYLNRNVEKERSKSGAVFMDYRNADAKNQRHIVLYGHNMNNGTMFNGLNDYKKKDFFDNNRKIYLYWNETPVEYEVFAAYNVDVDIDFIKVEFSSDEDFLDTMSSLKSMSKFTINPDITILPTDQIITLTTCTYEYDNQRFVVQARRVSV